MGASKKLKMLMVDKEITQKELAEMLGKTLNNVRNTLYKDNFRMETLEAWADALGCDVVLRDRKTGKLYR